MAKKRRRNANRQTGRSSRMHDRRKTAKSPGKRRSKSGKLYYERRKNRSDKPGSLEGIKKPKGLSVKLKKLPKKPRAGASIKDMKEFLSKVRKVRKENNERITLAKQISKV